MKTKWIIVLVLSLILNLFLAYQIAHIYSRYDFFVDKEQKRKIDNFVEIATGSEIGVSQYIRKWEQPINIWIKSDTVYPEQRMFLESKIEELNEIAPEYLSIKLVEDSLQSNSVLTFCKYENVKNISPELLPHLKSTFAGWTNFYYSDYKIYRSQIFIKTSETMEIQKNTLIEELVQSLGLAQDILNDKQSLFYENKNKDGLIYHSLNEKDREIIEMLYHPKIKPGFDRQDIEKVLREIME